MPPIFKLWPLDCRRLPASPEAYRTRMIRFGIVGFGLHGVRRLMPGFAKAARCTVTAISRRDLAKARASAAEYNLPHFFDSTEALCACPDVDAVLVA